MKFSIKGLLEFLTFWRRKNIYHCFCRRCHKEIRVAESEIVLINDNPAIYLIKFRDCGHRVLFSVRALMLSNFILRQSVSIFYEANSPSPGVSEEQWRQAAVEAILCLNPVVEPLVHEIVIFPGDRAR